MRSSDEYSLDSLPLQEARLASFFVIAHTPKYRASHTGKITTPGISMSFFVIVLGPSILSFSNNIFDVCAPCDSPDPALKLSPTDEPSTELPSTELLSMPSSS